jgi:death-on-curing protein
MQKTIFGANSREDYVVLNYLHSQLMENELASADQWGQRDPKLTRAAVARPYRTAFGQELYPDVFSKAAALMDSIINTVVFKDGNKRTALVAVALYLALNDYVLKFGQQEAEWFSYQVVVAHLSIEVIANWLRDHTTIKPDSQVKSIATPFL